MRKISVSIFDGVSNDGALREICDFAGGFTGENLRENGTGKAASRPFETYNFGKS